MKNTNVRNSLTEPRGVSPTDLTLHEELGRRLNELMHLQEAQA